MPYTRADFAPLRDSVYGVGYCWTTAIIPRHGDPLAYAEAVARFDVDALVAQAVVMGAGHVLFTATHSEHRMPGPNAAIDRILPGRTCERDLLMDLADGLAGAGIGFMIYYNSGIHAGDPQWRQAVGADEDDPSGFFDNWGAVVGCMGERYGPKVMGLWVDSGYELRDLGDTPWEKLTAATKAGHPDRVVCYNPGIERYEAYTEFQDYWAGETSRLNYIPRGALTPAGLPWHAFVSWYGDSRAPLCGVWIWEEKDASHD